MATIGFREDGRFYAVSVEGDSTEDFRAEVVEFARLAGTSLAAFEFARKSCRSGVGVPGDHAGLYRALSSQSFVPVDDEPDFYIDFDEKALFDGFKTYPLEWLGRGGQIDVPHFAKENDLGWSLGVDDPEAIKEMVADGQEYAADVVSPGDGMYDVANVVCSSLNRDGNLYHRPMIDLDFDAALLPSSTPGHWHLYLDKVMDDETYKEFIKAMNHFGIVANGNVNQLKKGGTFLRLPHVRKGDEAFLAHRKSAKESIDLFDLDYLLASNTPF